MDVNTIFEIHPKKGAGVIKFGMRRDKVNNLLGVNDDYMIDNNRLVEFRSDMNISYTADPDGKVFHIGFSKGMNLVMFDSVNIFHDNPDIVINKLIEHDDCPYLSLGMVFFMKLGITLTGFHDDDSEQKSLAVFNHSEYEQYIDDMEPFIDAMNNKYHKAS
ncbi:hypothetical protein [Hafnia alvei]|uniref:Uncharacterized protein n=1 Tax=Hafnia alvei ATCC 51873 TaxID=1002364 RepID=G9YAC9_HAFAL|nr:hypothetical protein [Hafnia alvei]EHM40259.1 hypothetical protein HMPREF0454_03553 [Hafnia alvei ATCC 51873]QQE45317.1 hypothetical protein I6H95_08520 [Hafnia alvei]